MSETSSLFRDFLRARAPRKAKYVFWTTLGAAIAAGTVWVIVGIVRLHLLLDPTKADPVEDKLATLTQAQESELAAAQHAPKKEAAEVKPSDPNAFPFPYEIKSVAVPIANHGLNKALYMQFSVIYNCPNQASVDVMQMSRARLRSMLYETAILFNEDDFRTAEGFDRFRNELLGTLKAAFGQSAPTSVALKDVLVN